MPTGTLLKKCYAFSYLTSPCMRIFVHFFVHPRPVRPLLLFYCFALCALATKLMNYKLAQSAPLL